MVPLHAAVAGILQAWILEKSPSDESKPLFELRTKGGGLRGTSKTMKLDLERAGLPYCDEDGLYADFHPNRHTFISNLAKAGVSPKLA